MNGAPAGRDPIFVTGIGVVTGAGIGSTVVEQALREGRSAVAPLTGEGIPPNIAAAILPAFDLGAQLAERGLPPAMRALAKTVAHRAPVGLQAAILAAAEAWMSAGLHARDVDASRTALVVGGHNVNQRLNWETAQSYGTRVANVPPSFALRYQDSDQLGSISEVFGIRGEGMVAGGASASGSMAVIQGFRLVRAGLADRCLVVAGPCDLSVLELNAFNALGVLQKIDGGRYNVFDRARGGFVYGQGAAAIVLERRLDGEPNPARVALTGASVALDATRQPTPSVDGEAAAMAGALRDAGRSPADVDYINPHATGSALGDDTEMLAIERVFGARASQIWLNATKAIVGHCLTSAGLVELVCAVIQMERGFLHPNPFISAPIRDGWRLVGGEAQPVQVGSVLKNGFGFGGINTSIMLERPAA